VTEVYVAIVLQLGTLLGLLITALVGRSKVDSVHRLVNGNSERQAERIEQLHELLAKRKPGRPRKVEIKVGEGRPPRP